MELQYIKMQIFEIGLLILAAYLGGKIARRLKIGEVIGQIVGGVLVGPHFLEVVHRFLENREGLKSIYFFKPIYHFYNAQFPEYTRILENYHFFTFLFLGIIAFSIGEELHRDRLKQVGLGATLICVFQGLLTFLSIFLGFWLIFDFPLLYALIIGSIGIATAPELTFILMNRLKIEGSLRGILANIVVLDDIIEVIFFSIFLGIAIVLKKGAELSLFHLTGEVAEDLLLAGLIGAVIYFVLKVGIRKRLPAEEEQGEGAHSFLATVLSEHPTPSVEILVVIIGIVGMGISVAIHFHLPFLITAVVAGFLIANFHSHAIFDSLKIENVMPLFNLLFFAIIGASVRLESFSKDTLIFVAGYIVLRLSGKLLGNWVGCVATRQDPKVTACLPKLMLPQAGVAAVETIFVAAVLKDRLGMTIFNTIIPAIVIFELGGAWLSERTLLKWKEWVVGELEAVKAPKPAFGLFSLYGLIENRVMEMNARTRGEAIFELAQLFVREGIIYETGVVTRPMLEREKLGSTAIGGGVALPHCRTGLVTSPKVACGLLRRPIDWQAPDGKPVELVFMVLAPEEHPEQYLKAVRTISTALMSTDFSGGVKEALARGDIERYLKDLSRSAEHVDAGPIP